MTILIIIAVVVVIALYIILLRNNLVSLDVNINESLAQIETQLQRRFDLIPNLVETVKGYTEHEKSTLQSIVEARSLAQSKLNEAKTKDGSEMIASYAEADKLIQKAGLQINALAENYPDLKASANYMALQEELATTENKVAFARQAYNDNVSSYNKKCRQFPSNIVAKWFHFTERSMFEVEDAAARKAPKVSFI